VVTASVHGDEPAGFAASLALDRWLPGALHSGRVVLYPAVNPAGLAARIRAFPEDLVDLNRCFPGDDRGGPSSRHAAALWRDLAARKPDAVIDLHADSPSAVPYALVDRAVAWRPDVAFDQRIRVLARATGFPVLAEYPLDQYLRFGLDRSLAGAVVNVLRIPALTLEVGPRRAIDPAQVGEMVAAVKSVLVAMGLCAGERVAAWSGPEYQRANAPRTRAAGLFVPALPPGGRFAKGDVLGSIYSADAEVLDTVVADAPGIAVSWVDGAWIDAGGVPGMLGLEADDA
jgi:predicted deacylase